MNIDIVDVALVSIIFTIVGYYAYLRYKEEKHKQEKQLIPMLEAYKEKFLKEKEEFKEKARYFKKLMEEAEKEWHQIKQNIPNYKWTEEDKKYLKELKGTDFERTFTVLFHILGFKTDEPPIYKDHNIDLIIETEKDRICVDFIDFSQVKKINEDYLQDLEKGREKYRCKTVWILTNTDIPEDKEKLIYKYDMNLFEFKQIVKFFPSYRIVVDYDRNRTKFHNFELLHKETQDEIIRRDYWVKEVEEKLEEAKKKRMDKSNKKKELEVK